MGTISYWMQWFLVLNSKLSDDSNSSKARLVFFNRVAEALLQHLELLESLIHVLMPLHYLLFHNAHWLSISLVWHDDCLLLAWIAKVGLSLSPATKSMRFNL